MFKMLSKFKGKEWALIVVAVAFIAFGVWMDLTLPDYLERISVILGARSRGIPIGSTGEIWQNGGIMLAFAVGSALTTVIVGYIVAVVSSSHAARLRKELFEKVGNFSTAEMKSFSVSSLITRSTNDVSQVRMFFAMGMQMLIKAPITAIWAIVKISGKQWQLSVVVAVAVVSLIVIVAALILLVLPRFKSIQKLTDNLNQVSRENLTGLRVVRAYNAEDFQQEKFNKANIDLTKTNLTVNRAMGLFIPFIGLLLSGLNVAIYWVAAILINNGSIADVSQFGGEVMVFSQYSFQIIFAFMMMIIVFVMMPRALVSARRINEVLGTKPSVVDGHTQESSAASEGAYLSFKNVSFKYPGAEESVIKDVNLDIKRGSTVAFIGGTGCGKSTLVNLIPRIYDATDGEIMLDGLNVRDYALDELNSKIGYVPQTAVLFAGTIKSNIAFGTVHGGTIQDDDVVSAIEVAQAKEFIDKLSEGVDAPVSQYGKNLSGGQKQRVAIARVVARKPEIFIFDDTFSALDYKTDRALRSALKKATKNATVLIVAQRIGTIKDADLICVLEDGVIVGQGKHNELLASCKVYKEIALSQLTKEELA